MQADAAVISVIPKYIARGLFLAADERTGRAQSGSRLRDRAVQRRLLFG